MLACFLKDLGVLASWRLGGPHIGCLDYYCDPGYDFFFNALDTSASRFAG
jgi:hypothetical protein